MANPIAFIRARKIIFIPILIVLIILIARFIILQKPNSEILYTVKQENLVDTVAVSGTYTTASQTQVKSPTNGIISNIYVKNGDIVKKGESLFYVESTATEEEAAAANAAYQNAINNLKKANQDKEAADATMWAKHVALLNARETKRLKDDKISTNLTELQKQSIDASAVQTEKDFHASEKKYIEADAAVAAEQADLNEATLAYKATQSITVKAPASGTVVNLLVNIGDQVEAVPPASVTGLSTITTPVQPVLMIANLGNPYIKLDVSEDYAAEVEPGQKVSIVFDSLKNQTFTGRVVSMATVGNVTQGIITYSARVFPDDLPDLVKPNMTALVTIETLRKNNVIDIPNSAIIIWEGDTYVEEANSHKKIQVKLGTRGMAKSEIIEGLPEGTVIVANP